MRCMCDACVVYVRYMCGVCTVYVRYMCGVCAAYVRCMCGVCLARAVPIERVQQSSSSVLTVDGGSLKHTL